MPNISIPKTSHAHEEIKGRMIVLEGQAAEARRMAGYYMDMAADQRTAAVALEALHASYQGLIEDAGVQ